MRSSSRPSGPGSSPGATGRAERSDAIEGVTGSGLRVTPDGAFAGRVHSSTLTLVGESGIFGTDGFAGVIQG